jgi:hypothetical protein
MTLWFDEFHILVWHCIDVDRPVGEGGRLFIFMVFRECSWAHVLYWLGVVHMKLDDFIMMLPLSLCFTVTRLHRNGNIT